MVRLLLGNISINPAVFVVIRGIYLGGHSGLESRLAVFAGAGLLLFATKLSQSVCSLYRSLFCK
jgi:hypothetical protein